MIAEMVRLVVPPRRAFRCALIRAQRLVQGEAEKRRARRGRRAEPAEAARRASEARPGWAGPSDRAVAFELGARGVGRALARELHAHRAALVVPRRRHGIRMPRVALGAGVQRVVGWCGVCFEIGSLYWRGIGSLAASLSRRRAALVVGRWLVGARCALVQ